MKSGHAVGFLAVHVGPLLQDRANHLHIAGFGSLDQGGISGGRNRENGYQNNNEPERCCPFRVATFAHRSTCPVLIPNLSMSQSNLFARVTIMFASGVSFAVWICRLPLI